MSIDYYNIDIRQSNGSYKNETFYFSSKDCCYHKLNDSNFIPINADKLNTLCKTGHIKNINLIIFSKKKPNLK